MASFPVMWGVSGSPWSGVNPGLPVTLPSHCCYLGVIVSSAGKWVDLSSLGGLLLEIEVEGRKAV